MLTHKVIENENYKKVMIKHTDRYSTFEEFMKDYCGYESRDMEMDRYGYWENPNAKWDWYKIGGRWGDMIKGKDNNTYNYIKIKDIDFSIDNSQYNDAIRFWELYVENDTPKNKKDEELIKWTLYKKEYYINRYKNKEQYAKTQSEFSTFAVITPDGKWHEKGEMGWFGCSGETDIEAINWDLSYHDMFIKNANPEHYLIMVDCHI